MYIMWKEASSSLSFSCIFYTFAVEFFRMRMQMSHYVNAGNNNQFSQPTKPSGMSGESRTLSFRSGKVFGGCCGLEGNKRISLRRFEVLFLNA